MFGAFRAATKVAPMLQRSASQVQRGANQAQRLGQQVQRGVRQAQNFSNQARAIQKYYGPYNRNRCNCNRRPNNVLAQGTSYQPLPRNNIRPNNVLARAPNGAGRPPNGAGRAPNGAGRPPNGAGRPPNGRVNVRPPVNKTRSFSAQLPTRNVLLGRAANTALGPFWGLSI
jgi:hypothetical protein